MVGRPRSIVPLALVLAGLTLVWGAMLWLGTGALDRAVLGAFYAGGDERWSVVARIITRLGDPDLLLFVTALAALLLLARRDRRTAALLLAISLSGRLLVNLQKAWLARPRPDAHLHLVDTRTDSFPSGHAACAVLVWVTLALLIPRGSRLRRPAIGAAILASVLAGVSRPMLGVHWPSDVVAGWALGMFWILLLTWLWDRRFRRVPELS
jgi:undecaprenyl-diphosphatase